jgi:hypothetical protein
MRQVETEHVELHAHATDHADAFAEIDLRVAWRREPEHRLAAERGGLRYPNDMNDSEWALIAPLIPLARQAKIPHAPHQRHHFKIRAAASFRSRDRRERRADAHIAGEGAAH